MTKKLPKHLKLDLWDILDESLRDEVAEKISDYLSNTYGYCINSYGYATPLEISDIDWDTDED